MAVEAEGRGARWRSRSSLLISPRALSLFAQKIHACVKPKSTVERPVAGALSSSEAVALSLGKHASTEKHLGGPNRSRTAPRPAYSRPD